MTAVRVNPVEHRVQVQSVIASRNEKSKKAKKCLFGSPKPGETDKLFDKQQANNLKKLSNYELVNSRVNRDIVFTFGPGSSEDSKMTIKRSGSPLLTDHFKKTKKVCKPHRPTLMTSEEKISDVKQCTETCEIGSTNFVTNVAASDMALEADVISTDEALPPTHQQNHEQSQQEVALHITVTNHAGKFS